MAGLANWGELHALDLMLGQQQTPLATVYIALILTEPGDADTGTSINEVSGGGYARVGVTNNATQWPAASGGRKSNGATIQFPTATADWGSARYFGVCSASSGGNLLTYGRLAPARNISSGQAPRFPAGSLSLVVD